MRDVISGPAPGLDLRRCRGAACPSRASHPNSATRRHHREGLKVCGLAAGGSRIRTLGPSSLVLVAPHVRSGPGKVGTLVVRCGRFVTAAEI